MFKASAIVCAIDVSGASRQSLPLAAKLAKDAEAKLVIVHPVPCRNWSIYTIMAYHPEKEAAEAAALAEPFVREIMSRTPEVKWELKVEAGNPADIIAAAAEEAGADLVLSARRRGRLEVLKSSSDIGAGALNAAIKTAKENLPLGKAGLMAKPHQAAVASN